MFLAVTILLWLFVAILAVLVGLLATPMRLGFNVKSDPGLQFMVIARPFGGACPPLRVIDSQRKRPKKEKPARKKKPGKVKSRQFASGRAAELRSELPKLLSGLLRRFSIESLSMDGEFGLADPADTGSLYGVLTPFIYGAARIPRTTITIRPNFEGRCLSGEFEGTLRFIPAALFVPVLVFAWNVFGPR